MWPRTLEVARAIKTQLGIGRRPTYKVKFRRGRAVRADFFCRVKSQRGAVVARFERTPDLIAPIPVQVTGVNPNWTIMYHERLKNQVRPLGQFDGKCIVMVDPFYEALDLFVGHPVTCNRSDLVIHVVRIGDDRWSVELHNPTDKAIETVCRNDPDWTLFKLNKRVTVKPKSSVSFEVSSR